MSDEHRGPKLSSSAMIRRAAAASRRMTTKERLELIKISEANAERDKLRWASQEDPRQES